MKGKQLLALVLVIAMMFGMMPDMEAAEHIIWPNTYCDNCGSKGISMLGQATGWYKDEFEHYYESIDKYFCEVCGYVMEVREYSGTMKHSFYYDENDEECFGCRYKNPFYEGEHQHVGISAKIDTEYRQYSNATAHQKRDVYGYTCSVCSETVIERYTEWIDENHKDSGQGWCLLCGAAIGSSNDEAYPIITNLSVSPNAAGMSTPISVSGLVDGNGGTIARVRVSVFYNDSLTSGKVYKDYEVNSATFDLSTVGTIVPGATLAQDGTLLIPDKGSYSLAVFATNTNGKGQGDSPALCGFTVGSCTHPNYGYDLNGKGRTVKLDDEKHLYTFPVIYTCTICGEKWNGTESTEGEHSLTIKTKHDVLNSTFHFVKKCVVCTAGCGMEEVVEVTTGNHNVSEEKSVKVTQFPQSNDRHVTEHVVTEVTSLTCADCKYEISTKSNEDWQKHSYKNDKCACGYSMVGEYYDVLRNLPSGSNPMENPVISEIVWAKLTSSGMNRDEAEEIHDMIENVPEKYATYRDIYLYSIFLFDTDRNWIPTEEISSSHFNDEDNKLNIEKNTPSSELPTTWFHEIGHAIDYNAGYENYITMNDEVFERMKDDVEKLVVDQATSDHHPILASKWRKLTQKEQDMIIHSIIGSNNGYPEQYDNISKKWSIASVNLSEDLQSLRDEIIGNMEVAAYGGTNDTRNAYMATDCVEGMTNGRVSYPMNRDNIDFFDSLYKEGKYYSGAHMGSYSEYWYNDKGTPTFYQCAEAWAEYLSAVMTNNTDAINSNLYYFSSTCEYFEQTLAPQVLENIKKLALE